MSWQDRAACRGMDPGVFFEEHQQYPVIAKAICGFCPVRLQCLEDGMAERHGVRGGLTAEERRAAMSAGERRALRGRIQLCSGCGRRPRNPATGTCAECAHERAATDGEVA